MLRFIVKNNLYVMAALAVAVAVYVTTNWTTLPFLQRMVGLFFVGLVMHLWEEGRFPGGFVEAITKNLHFTASSREFGEVITAAVVLIYAFVPLLLPQVPFLVLAAMMLGVMEVVMHVAMIRMFKMPHPYSPGLATAVLVLLPISLFTFSYAIRHDLVPPIYWLYAILYMLAILSVGQQIVIRASGMRYSDFLKNVRAALAGGKR